MIQLKNRDFRICFSQEGFWKGLYLQNDNSSMNWLINGDYIRELGYEDEDKLTGIFHLDIGNRSFTNYQMKPVITEKKDRLLLQFPFDGFLVEYAYTLKGGGSFIWDIAVRNQGTEKLLLNRFTVWFSLANVMFRDLDTIRNREQSCALFPSLSPGFSKFSAVKRDNQGLNLGIYQTEGTTVSLGSFCRYTNNFLFQASPSLDGLIFHQLVLAGGQADSGSDWVYAEMCKEPDVPVGEELRWKYEFRPYGDPDEFSRNGLELGHPWIDYSPVVPVDGRFEAEVRLPAGRSMVRAWMDRGTSDGVVREDVSESWRVAITGMKLSLPMRVPGERKLGFELDNGKTDFVVFNVMEPARKMIEERVGYLCRNSYNEQLSAFEPVSNQGESLGKLCLILQKNLVGSKDLAQVGKVEQSAVFYIKKKWFADGDFARPLKLFGRFYRIFDFDYIAHVFYLLSQFAGKDLRLHPPETYLRWAAEIMILRFTPDLHSDEREKTETGLNGVFTLYIRDLLKALDSEGLREEHLKLSRLWEGHGRKLKAESGNYRGVITEHYYDNAGFGPTCESLCLSGHLPEAEKYGELILANIGRSNDYRAQNPDRWWESLAYMLHSLWGGLVSNSALVAYGHLRKTEYLKAAYRSMMPLFFCYDWHAVSTEKRLTAGEAASTYCVSSPNLNKPALSRNRFGQSAFLEDGEVFANATGDDWDMGEEMAAYLNGFGTKTYLYYEDGEIRCINGSVVKDGEMYIVTSYAAYPKDYYFYEENLSLKAEDGQLIPRIVLENGRMRIEAEEAVNL